MRSASIALNGPQALKYHTDSHRLPQQDLIEVLTGAEGYLA